MGAVQGGRQNQQYVVFSFGCNFTAVSLKTFLKIIGNHVFQT